MYISGGPAKIFHGVGIGPLSEILVVKIFIIFFIYLSQKNKQYFLISRYWPILKMMHSALIIHEGKLIGLVLTISCVRHQNHNGIFFY